MNTIDELVQNDTEPALEVTYDGVDVTGFLSIKLHIGYKPYPLVIDRVLHATDVEQFYFPWKQRVSGVLASAAAIGATSVDVTITGSGQVFADLPASGELLIGNENVLYSSKTAPSTITLASSLTAAHEAGEAFEKLPDLRAGHWKMQIETIDADGAQLTFGGLAMKVEDDIA